MNLSKLFYEAPDQFTLIYLMLFKTVVYITLDNLTTPTTK